jgi:hypothetical protein
MNFSTAMETGRLSGLPLSSTLTGAMMRGCHCRCSEPLDRSDCYTKSSAIEVGRDRALSPRQEVESKRDRLLNETRDSTCRLQGK